MANYQVTAPDGTVLEVTAPDTASQEEVLAYAQQHHRPRRSYSERELGVALQRADAAGNWEDARRLAQEIGRLRAERRQVPPKSTLAELKASSPAYAQMSDAEFAQRVYQKHYAGKMTFDDFSQRVGIQSPPIDPKAVQWDDEPLDPAAIQWDDATAKPASAANNSDFARMITGKKPRREANLLDALGREVGLGGRAAIRGVYDLTSLLGGDLLNAAESKIRGVPVRSQRENADWLADTLGLPSPETSTERVGGDITGALVGGGGLFGLGRGLLTKAPGVVRGVGEALTSMPGTQLVSTVGGSGASSVTHESGGGAGAQTIAGLLGGLGPAGVVSGSSAAVRGAVRGGEAGRKAMQSRISDFRAAGTTPTVGQASGRRVPTAVEVILSRLPGSAGVIARKADEQGQEIGARVRSMADVLSPGADPTTAGQAIRQGIVGPGGFQDRVAGAAGALYGRLDELIDPAARVGVQNTRGVLDSLNPDIPGAPSLTPMFQNGRIEGIKSAFQKDVSGTAALMDRPGMVDWANGMREALTQEANAVVQENLRRRSMMLPPLPVPTAADIDARINGMMQGMIDDRLPYEALKKLRTQTGKELANANFASDVPVADWRQLYGGLSRDMAEAARDHGPAGTQAFSRANRHYNAAQKRSDAIAHVVNRDTPEQIFMAAISGTDKGATTLSALLKSLPDRSRREVAAAVLDRMGRASKGQQNAEGSAFSTQTFLTNWNGLSPRARSVLFDRFGAEFRGQVQAITRVAGNLRDGAKVYSNPSGTAAANAQNVSYAGLGGGVVAAALGHPLPLLGTVGGIGANNGLARLLTNPRTVDWLAAPTPVPYGVLAPTAFTTSRSGK